MYSTLRSFDHFSSPSSSITFELSLLPRMPLLDCSMRLARSVFHLGRSLEGIVAFIEQTSDCVNKRIFRHKVNVAVISKQTSTISPMAVATFIIRTFLFPIINISFIVVSSTMTASLLGESNMSTGPYTRENLPDALFSIFLTSSRMS